ncbi:MAG TPA: BlaI/MecI/CopY family transcriptional regulator [Pirellulales bacterium]|nr:BlaI/MecI/CopY family transcriptional regulator [Pirellulales bacterium]
MSDLSPSERELDVLKVLWELGEAKVRDVHAAMSREQKTAFTTVQTLLRIMAEKGLVKQRSIGRTLFYSPRHTREQVSSRFLKRVFNGALDKLVLNMLQAEDVSPDEMRELERLIAKTRRQKEGPTKEGSRD